MLAAADHAENPEDCAPPPILSKAFLCQYWHCLPSDLDKQDAGIMSKMTAAMNVHNAFTGFHHAKNAADWKKDNPEAARIMMEIAELRKNA
jgi:hypothetical protein